MHAVRIGDCRVHDVRRYESLGDSDKHLDLVAKRNQIADWSEVVEALLGFEVAVYVQVGATVAPIG